MRVLACCTVLMLAAVPAAAQTGAGCAQPVNLNSNSATDARAALRRAVAVVSPSRSTAGLFRAPSEYHVQCADSLTMLATWSARASREAWRIQPVTVQSYGNSAYPRSVNDQGSWRGTGLNLEATAGAEWRWRFLSGAIAPEFYYNANTDHPVASGSMAANEFGYPYHGGIDLPKRFGTAALNTVAPGQSYLRAEYGPVAATLSTENMWIGAAEVYPIILSNTAPGFPHLRLGTSHAVNIGGVLNAEFHLFFGSLHESEYFDTIPGNDEHFFMTAMLTVEPRFLPGLYLAVGRADHDSANATGQSLGFYLDRVFDSPFGGSTGTGNRVSGNAIGFLLARWVLPASGFEAYAEWAKEDTPGGWDDLLREPDWTQAYVLGFQKVYPSAQRMTRLYGELIHLGASAPVRAGRGFFSYYTHSTVTQGHTHRGQLLGAAIGPGSDAQLIGVDFFSGKGRSAARIERTRYDDDAYYERFARRFGETRHDAEISLSVSRLQMFGPLEVEGEVMFSRRYDRAFIAVAAEQPNSMIENNWGLRLAGSWRPQW